MQTMFPRTEVAGVSLPRMLMGTNWILGYSHTSSAADCMINRRNRNRAAISEIAGTFLSRGVDACMAPFTDNPVLLDGIRDAGMIPGLSAHMPELIVYSDENGYDVETYIQLYNCMGFLMQVEVEYINKVIWNAKKPVMSIKPMAAGRCSPFVGLNFAFATLRPCDMVTVGCLTPEEAAEDIEIGLAAIERRQPDLEGRSSPARAASAVMPR